MNKTTMQFTRKDIILAAFAASNENHFFSPIQVQKLFFLIDKKIAPKLGGPFFEFKAHHYGPYDEMIYKELEELNNIKEVCILTLPNGLKSYFLSVSGRNKGKRTLKKLEDKVYLKKLTTFVIETPLIDLVASIYKAYPEMKENAVFMH